MNTYHRAAAMALATLTMLAGAHSLCAEGVVDWRTYKNGTATTMTGQGTNDPVFGDLTTTANQSFVVGYLTNPAVLGPNVGDKITLSFGVAFNDNVGMANAGDNFRFALFDLNGEIKDSITGSAGGTEHYNAAGTANTDNYRGYWIGARNGSGTGSTGSVRERAAQMTASQNVFTNNATDPAQSIGTVGGDPVTLVSDVQGDGAGADYLGTLVLTRNISGLIDVSGTFIGSNAATGNVVTTGVGTAAITSTNFGAVAFLLGNALSNDQFTFTDVDVTVGGNQTIVGDFNNDTKVDDVDFGIWKGDFGTSKGGQDFLDWQENYGTGVAAQALAGAVPEPGTAAMLAIGLAGLVRHGRRRAAVVA